MAWAGCWQAQRFGQIPEQFLEIPHNREHRKHLSGNQRGLSPVLSTESVLGNLLSGTKAVINRTTSKALLPEAGMDAAAEVCL